MPIKTKKIRAPKLIRVPKLEYLRLNPLIYFQVTGLSLGPFAAQVVLKSKEQITMTLSLPSNTSFRLGDTFKFIKIEE